MGRSTLNFVFLLEKKKINGEKNKNPMVGGRERKGKQFAVSEESLAEKGGNRRGAGITFSGEGCFH